MTDPNKRLAAEAVLAEISPGMRLGLGSGSTASLFIELLGERVAQGLDCVGVPTSAQSAALAETLGIRLVTLQECPELDLTVDGADEIDPDLNLIKGGGGAMLREKVVAAASRRMAVVADDSKRVDTLGAFPLPIEVDPFALGYVQGAILAIMRDAGSSGEVVLRVSGEGDPVVTDGGHLIFDASFGRISVTRAVARALDGVPGVVGHGLFVGMGDIAYIGTDSGVEIIRAGRDQSGSGT